MSGKPSDARTVSEGELSWREVLWAISGDILVRLLNTLSPDPEPHSAQAEVLPVGVMQVEQVQRSRGRERVGAKRVGGTDAESQMDTKRTEFHPRSC